MIGPANAAAVSSVTELNRNLFLSKYHARCERLSDDGFIPTLIPNASCGLPGYAYALTALGLLNGRPSYVMAGRRLIDYAERDYASLRAPVALTALVASASVFHGLPGLYWVKAWIERETGDERAFNSSVRRFIESTTLLKSPNPDLWVGAAGTLVAAATLHNASNGDMRDRLSRVAQEMVSLLEDATAFHVGNSESPVTDLNFGHGWAGILYALLRASALGLCVNRKRLLQRLNELEAKRAPQGIGGVTWPRSSFSEAWGAASWCNGASGQVFTWIEAYRVFGQASYKEIAEEAAFFAGQHSQTKSSIVCCGLAGQIHALNAISRVSSDEAWSRRAAELSELAAAQMLRTKHRDPDDYEDSLFSGASGCALLFEFMKASRYTPLPLLESWQHFDR